jgi:predicted small lipoprotein YifL
MQTELHILVCFAIREMSFMDEHKTRKTLALMMLISILAACNQSKPQATPLASTQPPATETVVATDTATSASPTETPIQHQVIPLYLPPDRSNHAGDQNSSVTANQKKANGGDRFTFERFERPFNWITMEVYYPELDIIDTLVYVDDTWVYGTIKVVNRPAAGESPFRFAMQLDVWCNN